MELLLKSLKEYFDYLGKHDILMDQLIKTTAKPIDSLKSLAEQHRSVSKAELGTLPIARISGIKENLLFKIENAMDEEVVDIQNIIEDCKAKNLALDKKRANVMKCLEKMGDLRKIEDRNPLCCGTPRYPSVLEMVEWVDDCSAFYNALHLKFSTIIMLIQSEDDKRVASELSKNYLHSEDRELFIARVLAMTKKFVDDS
ncbi:uncharacterized protein LOC124164025 [Ischnura elegans]|uniref:uncharacterized protein LOC124164025 n=1 Tax=Ischnura elegans TaxID=197161 RepID=UPI001ED87161|nr:uncharacterized protein LOC124164025 [Ischnura elegans]XP_046397132.1 uncharacterized protein LOC124164025 [Ischnura elegans]XP_046397133.1 uncharacterized protein LOC124164025 [Ischnura elegans]XP_046397134.1 uncharacterized protein LOC124164025 [Ischnura elegans]XP_046397135.1 uncharacterized protein LOC124164025 [Ischnura elegans]